MKQAELGAVTAEARDQLRRLMQLPTLREHASKYIREVVALCGGDLNLAAKVLSVGRATLYRHAKRLEIETKTVTAAKAARARERAIRDEFAVRGGRL